MINKNLICVCFLATPEGTRYRPNAYSWVPLDEGLKYIDSGMGIEWIPGEGPVDKAYQKISMENTKKEIKAHLDAQGILYSDSMTKSELLELHDTGRQKGSG